MGTRKMSPSASFDAHEADIELEDFASSSSHPRRSAHGGEAAEPLLLASRPTSPVLDATGSSLSGIVVDRLYSLLPGRLQRHISVTMSKFSDSKAARLLERLETEHEPGLSNAQMFLTNHDLKPVEEARRKWGAWNFVGTISLFNLIVSLELAFGC